MRFTRIFSHAFNLFQNLHIIVNQSIETGNPQLRQHTRDTKCDRPTALEPAAGYHTGYQRQHIGDRSFPVAAARVWNSLPQRVSSSPSLTVFRSRLKTHLFSRSFP